MSDKLKALLKQASFDKEASLKEYATGALQGINEVSRKTGHGTSNQGND